MSRTEYLQECLQQIEDKAGQGSSESWTHHHFQMLSQEISEASGIYISESTLKRLFGKRSVAKAYTPQAQTKNALAIYLGHQHWEAFKKSVDTKTGKPTIKPPATKKSRSHSGRYIVVSIIGVCAVGLALFLLRSLEGHIECQPTSKNIPFTSSIQYEYPGLNNNQLSIDIYEYEPVELTQKKGALNFFFNIAGYHRIRLMHAGKEVAHQYVHAKSTHWQSGTLENEHPRFFTQFYKPDYKARGNGFLTTDTRTVQTFGIDTLTRYWTEHRLFRDFGVDLDMVTFETKIINNQQTGGKPCYDVQIRLIGENGKIDIVLIEPGCERYAQFIISDAINEGQDATLPELTTPLDDWVELKIAVENNKADIFLDTKKVMEEQYTQPIGQMKGIIFSFYGSGQSDYVRFTDTDGKELFVDDF